MVRGYCHGDRTCLAGPVSPPKSWLASSLRFSSPAEGTEIEAWAELGWDEDKMGINWEGGRKKGRGRRGWEDRQRLEIRERGGGKGEEESERGGKMGERGSNRQDGRKKTWRAREGGLLTSQHQ